MAWVERGGREKGRAVCPLNVDPGAACDVQKERKRKRFIIPELSFFLSSELKFCFFPAVISISQLVRPPLPDPAAPPSDNNKSVTDGRDRGRNLLSSSMSTTGADVAAMENGNGEYFTSAVSVQHKVRSL